MDPRRPAGCSTRTWSSTGWPGSADIGELVVHMMTGQGYDERGVIGLGEPPVVSPGAAISNAVANAIGVRVPALPLTPRPRARGSRTEGDA